MRSQKYTPKEAATIFRFAKQHSCKIDVSRNHRALFNLSKENKPC